MIVVSGGGTGIGRAVAMASADAGELVLATGRREEPLADLVANQPSVRTLRCDHSLPEDLAVLAGAIADLGEPVTGLVLAAGGNPAIGRPEPSTLSETLDLLHETITMNLATSALTVEALGPQLADGASVVLFGSIAAERGVGFYGPAKAAVGSLAVGLAARLGERGITVNCISPGFIEGTEFFHGGMSAERSEQLRASTLTGRNGSTADVVGLVSYLLSDAARHITGQTLHLGGGSHSTR